MQMSMKFWIISKIHTLVDIEEILHVDPLYLRCGKCSTGHIRKWHKPIIMLKAGIADFNLCVQHGILNSLT